MMTERVARLERHPRTLAEVDLKAAGIIGFVAALIMAFFTAASGSFLLVPGVSFLIMSGSETAPGLSILSGLVVHLAFGAVFGVIYAALYTNLTSRYSLGTSIPLGVIYGVALWVLNFVLIGQALNLTGVLSIPGAIAIASHLIFGFVVGLYPILVGGR